MRRRSCALLLAGLVACAACAGDGGDDTVGPAAADGVRIASFDFAESELLGELYAQRLESVDVPVVRLGVIGPREVIAPSLELDRIDLVPEYLGTALQFFGATATHSETTTSINLLRDLLAPRGLTVLDPADAEDSNAVVVTSGFSARNGVTTITELSPWASELRFGGPVECPDRPLCLVGLGTVYGLEFAEFVPVRSVRLTAEALRRDEIDVGLVFTTSPELDDPAFVVLVDDRELQPAENVIPLIRLEALDRWGPTVTQALNGLAAQLTTDDLRAMNRRVDDGSVPADVAARWLAERHFELE